MAPGLAQALIGKTDEDINACYNFLQNKPAASFNNQPTTSHACFWQVLALLAGYCPVLEMVWLNWRNAP